MPLSTPSNDAEAATLFLPTQSRAMLTMRLGGRIAAMLVFVATALFLTAGTTSYWEGWAYLAAVFVPVIILGVVLLVRAPAIVEHRLRPRHHHGMPQLIISWFRPLFVLAFLAPGLDYRFRWSDVEVETVPGWLALVADIIVVASVLLAGWAMRTEVQAGGPMNSRRALISSGPFHIVRHPLYSASLLLWLATPIALGSWAGLLVFLLATPFYVLRLRTQEDQLRRHVPGYAAYCKRTPFRIVPFVW